MHKNNKYKTSMTLSEKIIFYFTLISLIGSLIFVIVQIILAPNTSTEPYEKVKSDYALTVLQCCAALIVMHLPVFLEHKFTLRVPQFMNIMYLVFLYCAVYLGEFHSFYFLVPHWDTILHTFSGAMLGAVSFSIISGLTERGNIKLSPALVAIFAFCFAVAVGVIWEIYEFIWDTVGNMNMQKYADEYGREFVGRLALMDTMEDLIVDSVGGAVMAVVGYISLKFDKNWVEKFIIRKKIAETPVTVSEPIAPLERAAIYSRDFNEAENTDVYTDKTTDTGETAENVPAEEAAITQSENGL